MALFEGPELTVGAVYCTVTVCPTPTEDAKVNSTVDPLVATPVTVRVAPFTCTTKAPIAAVVAARVSLYVRTTFALSPLTAADWNTGDTLSNVELFVTLTALELKLAASLPAES